MIGFLEFMEIGAALGAGFYIGFEGMKILISLITDFSSWICAKVNESLDFEGIEDDEEDESEWS